MAPADASPVTAFASLQRASFRGVEFPVRRMTVRGALNHHVHVFPHAAGGAFENMKRKLYEVRMSCPFLQRFPKYPNLWPRGLAALRQMFETGDEGDLVIPTIGTIKARCLSWPEEMDAKIQSGVMAEFEFLESLTQEFLVSALIQTTQANLESAAAKLDDEVNKRFAPPDDPNSAVPSGANETPLLAHQDIFDSIRETANAVFSIKDQINFNGGLIEAKILGLAAILREADETVVALQNPQNWPVVDALHELAAANRQLLLDFQGKRQPMRTYTVPMTMAVSDISVALYGNNSNAVFLLQTNAIEDALAVPAGFQIRYYPELKAA